MAYSSWTSNMNGPRPLQRQQCYLCDLPRAPWAILSDFSEPICRGCCNYEGNDRIETVIEYVRSLRKGYEHQIRALKAQSLNSTGNSIGSSPSPGGNSTSSMGGDVGVGAGGASVSLSNSYVSPYPSLMPPHHHDHSHFRFTVKHEQNGEQNGSHPPPPESLGRKTPLGFAVPGEPQTQPPRNVDEAAEEHRRMIANMVAAGKEPPRIPIIRRPPEFSEYPDIVRETLEVLNSCVPFDVRFKKDHNHVGRVFLFEAAPRTGATAPSEFELKIHIEYPRGSENFSQSASSVAKQMYQDSMKEFGRGLSSGFKYLEYEIHGQPTEYRLLGDLLPEAVRVFKEPIARALLPARLAEAALGHPLLGPPMFAAANQKFAVRQQQKRKATDELDLRKELEPLQTRAPRRTYKEREDEQIQRHLWMQSQVDALRLSMTPLGPAPPLPNASDQMHIRGPSAPSMESHRPGPMTLNGPLTPGPHQNGPHSGPPRSAPWNGVPSSMAALINAAAASGTDTVLNRTMAGAAKKSPDRPDMTHGKATSPSALLDKTSPGMRCGSGGGGDMSAAATSESKVKTEEQHIEHAAAHSMSPGGRPKVNGGGKVAAAASSQLKCSICDDWLEDTHFVQCPSVGGHKFCFPCSKESIKKQAVGSDVFCPSGLRCPLIGSSLPWAFMQSEIQTILATKGSPKQPSAPQPPPQSLPTTTTTPTVAVKEEGGGVGGGKSEEPAKAAE